MSRLFQVELDDATAERVERFATEHHVAPSAIITDWVSSYARTVGQVVDHELLIRCLMQMPAVEAGASDGRPKS